MIPFCFKQTVDGDIDPTFQFTSTLVEVAGIRIVEDLSLFLGEWFLDQRAGVPYFKYIIGQKYDPGLVQKVFRKACLANPYVATVNQLITSFDRRARKLSISTMNLTLVDGSTLTLADLAKPFVVDLVNPQSVSA